MTATAAVAVTLEAEVAVVIGKIKGKPFDLRMCGREVATHHRKDAQGRVIDVYVKFDNGKLFYWATRKEWAEINQPFSPITPIDDSIIDHSKPVTKFEGQW